MQILLVAATSFEIQPIVMELTARQFLINQCHITVLLTGVGQVSTTYLVSESIRVQSPNLVIQAGIAGSFCEFPALSTPVLVKKDTFGDLGMEEKEQFRTVFDAGFASPNQSPFQEGWLINDHPLLAQSPFPVVSAVTVNKISDSNVQRQQLVQTFDPQIESMEGAALHYVCLQQQIPFLQLRTISNQVGDRNKLNWKMQEAIHNLDKAFFELLAML